MSAASPELHLLYQLANAPLRTYPFPHVYAGHAFPDDYYAQIQRNLPPGSALTSLEMTGRAKGYTDRFIMPLGGELPPSLSAAQKEFWRDLARWVFGGRIGPAVLERFAPIVEQRLSDNPDMEITDELMVVRDRTRYSLGPHTDSPRKVVSVLFYLPADEGQARYGTSLYVPKERGFASDGTQHLPFERFERVTTLPFVPNSVLAFPRTDTSFHGVEPIGEASVERNLLLYDLRLVKSEQAAAPGGPQVRFTM